MGMRHFSAWFHSPEDLGARCARRAHLFCFPFAGASPSAYHTFCKAMPADIMPFVARSPWRDSQRLVPGSAGIPQIVEQLTTAILPVLPERPTIFWGHSMGALVAFELARVLSTRNVPRLLIVSGHRAPHLPRTKPPKPIDALSHEEFIEVLKDYGGTPQAVLESRELLDIFLPRLRADLSVLENYNYVAADKLGCDILCINGSSDHVVDAAGARAWSEHTSGKFRCEVLPGGHFFANESRTATVGRISAAIGEVLLAGRTAARVEARGERRC